MLGYLLARAGVKVIVLEKHADFFRDFRGDTIHPSTMQVMDELGILDDFLRVKHDEIRQLSGRIGGKRYKIGDFGAVPGRCKFLGFMPQWDFLNFLAEKGRALPEFRIEMQTEAVDLLFDGERVSGIRANSPGGTIEVRAPLVVAADGRASTTRERAGLRPQEEGVPIDVLWFRVSKSAGDPLTNFGNIVPGGILVTIDRTEYYQCAFVIQKGGFGPLKERGIEYFRQQVATIAPYLGDRVSEIQSFDQVMLLTVAVNRLPLWYRPGLLCIGDAAHAMSPVGGVGINLAIQDAVATANLLAGPLKSGAVRTEDLAAVQHRREFPTRVIQKIQLLIQNRVMQTILNTSQPFNAPWPVVLLDRFLWLRYVPAYLVGIGPRPEHVRI